MTEGRDIDRETAAKVLPVLKKTVDVLFAKAPVMMHSRDSDGSLNRVNDRWSQVLGYEPHEVLGKSTFEFLTDDSRLKAINDVLPMFWRAGSARSVGFRFVRKDGRTLDLMLDADARLLSDGTRLSYAALYSPEDPTERREASRTLRALKGLDQELSRYERLAGPEPVNGSEAEGVPAPSDRIGEPNFNDTIAAFLEVAQDSSANLRALASAHQDLVSDLDESSSEQMLLLRSIDKTLAYMADSLAAAPGDPPRNQR